MKSGIVLVIIIDMIRAVPPHTKLGIINLLNCFMIKGKIALSIFLRKDIHL